jgi:hypothetical protein
MTCYGGCIWITAGRSAPIGYQYPQIPPTRTTPHIPTLNGLGHHCPRPFKISAYCFDKIEMAA